MNDWLSRVSYGLLMYAAMRGHDLLLLGCENSPEWMLIYHGSAATFDLALLLAAQWFFDGKLCDHIEALSIASIITNALGWVLYLAYAPPFIYDLMIAGLCYVQYARLLIMDDTNVGDAYHMGFHLVRGPHHVGS